VTTGGGLGTATAAAGDAPGARRLRVGPRPPVERRVIVVRQRRLAVTSSWQPVDNDPLEAVLEVNKLCVGAVGRGLGRGGGAVLAGGGHGHEGRADGRDAGRRAGRVLPLRLLQHPAKQGILMIKIQTAKN